LQARKKKQLKEALDAKEVAKGKEADEGKSKSRRAIKEGHLNPDNNIFFVE